VLFHNATLFFKDHELSQSLTKTIDESKKYSNLNCFCCKSKFKILEIDSQKKFLMCSKCYSFWFSKENIPAMPFDTSLDNLNNYYNSSIPITDKNKSALLDKIILPFTLEENAVIKKNVFPLASIILGALMLIIFKTRLNTLFMFDNFNGFTLKTLITAFLSSLTHANLMHILGNLFVYASFAPVIERYSGRINFLILFFFSNFTSLIISTLVHSPIAVVGASVSISALIGAYVYFFPNAKVLLFFLFDPRMSRMQADNDSEVVLGNILKIPAFFYFFINILKDIFALNLHDGIYHIGHVIGFIFGYVWATQVNISKINPNQKVSLKGFKT
jgi:membrane associated rhomboid family serine protease